MLQIGQLTTMQMAVVQNWRNSYSNIVFSLIMNNYIVLVYHIFHYIYRKC